MPKFSAFTPFGMFAFSGKPSRAESIYRAIVANHGQNFSDAITGVHSAKWYAWSMALARARYTLERAGNQADPLKAVDCLPVLETMWGTSPGDQDTIEQRGAAVAAKQLSARAGTKVNIVEALQAALGSAFVALRTLTRSEAETADSPNNGIGVGKFQDAASRLKLIRLTAPVSLLGSRSVGYTHLDGDAAPIRTGEKVVIEAGRMGCHELVTVTAASTTTFTATFTRAHEPGALCTTGPYPLWSSRQRHSLIVVRTAEQALDPENIRKVNEIMNRMARSVSTWALVRETTPGSNTVGPFKHGEPSIGICPVGELALSTPGTWYWDSGHYYDEPLLYWG